MVFYLLLDFLFRRIFDLNVPKADAYAELADLEKKCFPNGIHFPHFIALLRSITYGVVSFKHSMGFKKLGCFV